MSDIQTIHRKDDRGAQITERVVTVTDAKGDEFEHVFRAVDGGHEYQGDGDPPESAVEAIEAFEEGSDE
ncbi:hypothetical protein ACFQMA_09345 [Halosimplex aquaticum]|uniref:DUF5786 domain-containing protein n=1 Tax=Halosimplex aquaticum TaxID=3026162 RepID=A0ABD5XY33_9EURY|nr:hypothetical protein [Halosimplex aquaticum]